MLCEGDGVDDNVWVDTTEGTIQSLELVAIAMNDVGAGRKICGLGRSMKYRYRCPSSNESGRDRTSDETGASEDQHTHKSSVLRTRCLSARAFVPTPGRTATR